MLRQDAAMGSSTDLSPTSLIGRDRELATIRDLLTGEGLVRLLVLEGEPGVGKTALWEQGYTWAREIGWRVVAARGFQNEAEVPYASLIDLFETVPDEDLAGVPAPQRRALQVALYRAEPGDQPPEPHLIALATLSALRSLAERGRLLVAVDDLQWLDDATVEVLAHVGQRLYAESVCFLVGKRPGPRTGLERALPPDRSTRMLVQPPGLAAMSQILSSRLGLNLSAGLVRRVFDATLGNPLFALELGRSLADRGSDALGDDLPLPDHLDDLLGVRIADLTPAVRRSLQALALGGELRRSQLEGLVGRSGVEDALAAGVLVGEGDRVRAFHPLFTSAARRQLAVGDEDQLHRDLADVVVDETRRALHLALATDGPDEDLAARLTAAAELASCRGATPLSVELAGHALRLTPEDVSDADRVIDLATYLHNAGSSARLTELLRDRVESLPAGAHRVAAFLLLTNSVLPSNDQLRVFLDRALEEAGDEPLLRGRVLSLLAENDAVIRVRGVPHADANAEEAMAHSRRGTPGDQQGAASSLAWTRALRGRPVEDLVAQVQEHEELAFVARHPVRVHAQRLVWRAALEDARTLLLPMRAEAEIRGELSSVALSRLHLIELELRAGGWDAAETLLDEWAATDADVLGWPMYERCRALLASGRGLTDEGLHWGSRAVQRAEQIQIGWDRLEATRALGQVALLTKDLETAVRLLDEVWNHLEQEGVLDPGAFPVAPDLVEALLETQAYDVARTVVARTAELAKDQDHTWARLAARRGAALLDVHEHDVPENAVEELRAVAAELRELGLAFEEARTWGALGRSQRRAKKWGAARDSLERAVAGYDAIGSPGWAEDARAELERVGARRPAAEGGLTATEARVAGLAVEGHSNKEIARILVVTVSTVEFHLRNVYGKLGIRSRAQLAPRLAELDGSDA